MTLSMLLVCVVSMLTVGCPTPLQYQPTEKFIGELEVPQAQQRMEEVLSRSINPRIIDVEVAEEFLRYRYPLEYLFGYPSGSTTREMRIVFMDVERVEIFHNHFVFIWASDKSIMAKILFANDQDAKLFTDLLLSFRARRVRGVRGSG